MDEQTQQEFLEWLTQQLGVQSEDELQTQMSQMGDEGIKKAFDLFQKQKQTPSNKEGGKLEYLAKLQQGGAIYTTKRGNAITDSDLQAYKNKGLDFGTKQAMGDWLDKWATPAPAAPAQPGPDLNKERSIRRFNQANMDYENVPITQVMSEPNKMQVGFSNTGIGNWDLSQFKKKVTPQDTIGMPLKVRNNVQQGWDMQGIHPKPTLPSLNKNTALAAHKQGGQITGKISDKGENKATALGKRKDAAAEAKTALKKFTKKGKEDKTAVGVTNWIKGKDAKTALHGRKEK